MTDAERIKTGLECCADPGSCVKCPYVEQLGLSCVEDCCAEALQLIQDLEKQIVEHPKVIICKACKHSSKSLSPYPEYGMWCNKHDRYVNADFYCGDGKEQKKDE